MAPRRRTGPRPARALAGLAVLILVMLISITGKETFNPSKWHQQFQVGLGLDLSSGTQVVLQAHTAKGQPPSSGAMQQAISVLESRVNGTGNSAAQVQQQGSDLINVSVPGGTAESTIKLVSTTAQLRFRQVLLVEPYSGSAAARPAAHPSGSATPHATPSGSASATPKAAGTSPKASTAALSARHASPSASPTATPTSTASEIGRAHV